MSAELTISRVSTVNYKFKKSSADQEAWIELTVVESDGRKTSINLFGERGRRILVTSGEDDD